MGYDYSCDTLRLLDGGGVVSGHPLYDTYFYAVTDAAAEAVAIAYAYADATERLAAGLGAVSTSPAEMAAAFEVRMLAETGGDYIVSVLPARCEISTAVVLRSFTACHSRKLEPDDIALCNGTCRPRGACVEGSQAICHGVAPDLICSGECRGECVAGGEADSCVGRCEGTCVGRCTVPLEGESCDGTCLGADDGGECTGGCELDLADGDTCDGTCTGTCDDQCQAVVDADGVCAGQCLGECTYLPQDGECAGAWAECSSAEGAFECSGICIGDVRPPTGPLPCELAASTTSKVRATCTPAFVAVKYEPAATLSAKERAELDGFVIAFRHGLADVLTHAERAARAQVALEQLVQAVPELDEDIEDVLEEARYGGVATLAMLQCAQETLPLVPEATDGALTDVLGVSSLAADLREELEITP